MLELARPQAGAVQKIKTRMSEAETVPAQAGIYTR